MERARTPSGRGPAAEVPPGPAGRAGSGSILARNAVAVVLAQVEAERGLEGVDAVLGAVSARRQRVEDLAARSWTPVQEVVAVFQAAAVTVGDPAVSRRAGASVFAQPHMAPVVALLRTLDRPSDALELIADTAATESAVLDLTLDGVRGDVASVSMAIRPPLAPDHLLCGYAAGLLSSVPGLFGLAPTSVTETECQADGAPRCRFVVAWGADADAGAAGTGRRQEEGGTVAERVAASLAAPGDLDRTLADVVAGATGAAAGRRGLLAVRVPAGAGAPGPLGDGEPQVFAYGLTDSEARGAARALDRVPVRPGIAVRGAGGWWLAPIDDGSGPAGYLAVDGPACDDPGRRVASWSAMASIAVRTATLGAAVRGRAQAASALADAAGDLARAGSKADVARVLARAAPLVVGGHRAVVAEWLPASGSLVTLARTAPRALQRTDPPPVVACGPFVERLVRGGHAIALQARDTEPVVEDLCRVAGFDTGLVVPLVARSRCYGVLVVDADPEGAGAGGPAGGHRLPRLARGEAAAGLASMAALAFDRVALADQAERGEHHDALTGLPDRRLLELHARRALAAAQREGRCTAMLYVDVDGLAALNDRFGRAVADQVLAAVGRRLQAAVRVADVVARSGGDEFAVLLPSTSLPQEATVVAERVAGAFAVPVVVGGVEAAVTVSVGAALSEPGDEPRELLARAVGAMRAAKAAGRGRIRLGSPPGSTGT